MRCLSRLECSGVDENGVKMIVPRITIDDQKTGLRCNRKPYFLSHFQAIAPREFNLVQKGQNLAFELIPQFRRKPTRERDLLCNDSALMI